MKKLHQKKILPTTISALMTLMVCQSVSVQASDIEIYRIAFSPDPVVMFALDNSGSMSGTTVRRAFDLKDSMQAVLLGEGTQIPPARNVLAGLSTFESTPWYPIYDNARNILYRTAVHPTTDSVDSDPSITVPRQNAGYIMSPVQRLDDAIVYPSTRQDIIPSNGDVILRDGANEPVAMVSTPSIDNNKKLYVRFQADIPKGAMINSAYLELRGNWSYAGTTLRLRMAQHNDLYAANPSITNLQTFLPSATSRSLAVDGAYLNKIFANATTQRSAPIFKNTYSGDNIGGKMYLSSMDVKSELTGLITNNNAWCGMGDIIFEVANDAKNTYTLFANREDRVNPQLHVEWTLDNNAKRTNNCMFADTKRSSAQKITNLGNVGATGMMTGRQTMNLQIQRILTDTRTPSSALLAETAAYMLGNSTKPISATGPANTSIDVALPGITTGTGTSIKYISPIKRVSDYLADSNNVDKTNAYNMEKQCGQHGLYFLTDGGEDPVPTTNDNLFKSSLLGGTGTFNCSGLAGCLPAIAGSLVQNASYSANNRGLTIKTSTVGFNISNTILASVASIGGGQYTTVPGGGSAAKTSIVNSISAFLDNVFNTTIPEVVTGSPTLPLDALNPLRIQPYGYYTSFVPKPQDTTQLWVGNLNKYNVVNGQLYDTTKLIRLINTDGSMNASANGIWTGGIKQQLPLGITANATTGSQAVNRTIYTNRQITNAAPFVATEDNSLHKVDTVSIFDADATKAIFTNDPQKNYWLNLLGYNVKASDTISSINDLSAKPELRQVGAVMHSTPLLLTQSGKITVDSSGNLDTTDRQDFLLFGSTQGLLHVVDTSTGKEKFAFAPNEMMENQKEAFLSNGGSSVNGSANLFYGVDAPWTAHTQYVSKSDKTLTVNDSGRTTDGGTNTDLSLKGLQWVYGGLRMGGRSYYALDLSNIDSPSLKFHIDPMSSNIYKAGSSSASVSALSFMGQSWSKPTLAYVKFGGVKKLVMFVGGGYDNGYESAGYDQNTTTGGGAGVYMFDANTGDLLWWTSANATSLSGAQAYTDASASSINMKYSVVSQINAIDRDNDGLVDSLYFGDLGGQAFRVDINNAAPGATATVQKANFVTHVVRLFNQHATGGISPRFYEMPSFTIHDSTNGYVGAVAFSSGNRSSPLSGAATTNGNQAGSALSASDGVFVVYDKDVAKAGLYALTDSPTATQLTTKNVSLTALDIGTGVAIDSNNGWKYTYSTTAGRYKGMNGIYALDGMLYVNVFDRDGTGIGGSGSCSGGVKGDSYVYQFCLPTGKCAFNTTNLTEPNKAKLGAGILGTVLGQGGGGGDLIRLTVNRDPSLDCSAAVNKNKPECQQFSTTAKIKQLRWYETR